MLGDCGMAAGKDALDECDVFAIGMRTDVGIRIKASPLLFFETANAETPAELRIFARSVMERAGGIRAGAKRKSLAQIFQDELQGASVRVGAEVGCRYA